jgi:hypothetical protein
MDMQDLMSTSS